MSALAFGARASVGARWRRSDTGGLLWVIMSIACMSPGAVTASPDTSANLLSEDPKSRCERAADTWFKKNYPLPEEKTHVASGKATYTSHFSATRNECFMEAVETAHIPQDGETQLVNSEIHQLIGLKTGEEIGRFVLFSNHLGLLWCEVAKVKCLNAKEWNTLVGAYMKD